MPSADPLQIIVSEGRRLVDTARANLDAPIPQYPEWTMEGLVAHTGAILGRTTLVCRDRLTERPSSPRPGEDDDVIEWFEGQLAGMVELLETTDHEIPVWGFGPKPTVGFWVRRMLIEAGVHRWDAQSAVGEPEPLLDEVAVAGLEEYPEMWFPRLEGVQTLQMIASDLERKWKYGDGDPAATVEGSASDLYLRLMSRPSPVVLPDDWAAAVDSLAPPPK